jgi:protein-histidine N-methyltransferase
LVLFQYALQNDLSLYFTLADFNASVLRLVTLPNLLLMWAATRTSTTAESQAWSNEGDLEVTPNLLSAFQNSLTEKGITLSLISGAWSPRLVDLVPTDAAMSLLCLASETIYSPDSLEGFTETLIGILQRVKMGKAMMGAKRVYFGVGGSVDAFKEACSRRNAVAYEIDNHGVDGLDGHGVRRCLLEVQMM